MKRLENFTFDEIYIGQKASFTKKITTNEIKLFAKVTGDHNPIHLNNNYAKQTRFKKRIAHGFLGSSFVSTLLGTIFPGPGCIYYEQTLNFLRPVFINDILTVEVEVIEKQNSKKIVLKCTWLNQQGKEVINGIASVLAPEEKIFYKKKRNGELVILWKKLD